MSQPVVTVLMAVHNTEPYLQEAIDSVLAQSLADLELLIVDDGSTDGSWGIISAAARRDGRVTARRRTTTGGASRALNDGLALSTGRFITRQDADDVSLGDRLAQQVAYLERETTDGAVGTQATLIDADGARLSETSFALTNHDIQDSLIETMCFVGPTVMVRRSTFEQAGLWFDEALSGTEDYDLCLRLSEVAGLANLQSPLYLYRQHPSSVSHSRRHQQLARKAQAVQKAVTRRHGAAPSPDAWIPVARDYLRAAVVAHSIGETAAARDWFDRALSFHPRLATDTSLVDAVLRRYLKLMPAEARMVFTDSLFTQVLSQTRELDELRRQAIADLQMAALAAGHDDVERQASQLWPAIRSNPASLLKRDVLVRIVKAAVGRS